MSENKISQVRLVWAVLSLLLIGLSWAGVARSKAGLVERRLVQNGVPLLYLATEGVQGAPGVVIAHGFSGSKQLMLGYGLTFARAGYAVMLLDFSGHGANPKPLDENSAGLQADLLAASQMLIMQPEVNPAKLALLGHSMGSGAVMTAGIEYPERYQAVIAISPTSAEVTPTLPPNLMLQAGSLEARFVENAQGLLLAAGGMNADFAGGQARTFVEIENVEHITILFNPTSHKLALEWLNQTYGLDNLYPGVDWRMVWYGMHLIGWLSLALALAPLVPAFPQTIQEYALKREPWTGIILAPFIATAVTWLINRLINLSDVLGMQVAGVLGIWLLVFGLIWLWIGFQPLGFKPASLARGALLFALLWIAFGLMAQVTWLQWFLIPKRLVVWLVLSLACLPWKLAAGHIQFRAKGWQRLVWWLAQSVFLTAGLVAAAYLIPGMFFLLLIAPAIPLVLVVEGVAAEIFDDPWGFGLGATLFFGWLIAALFPLV